MQYLKKQILIILERTIKFDCDIHVILWKEIWPWHIQPEKFYWEGNKYVDFINLKQNTANLWNTHNLGKQMTVNLASMKYLWFLYLFHCTYMTSSLSVQILTFIKLKI